MLLLGLDFESTGLAVDKVSATEAGLVFWDTDLHLPVKLTDFLIDPGPDAVWEKATDDTLAAQDVNGITPELCAKYGMVEDAALRQILSWYKYADAVVAHNGHEFDFPLLESLASKHGLEVPDKLRIDTKSDLQRPIKMSSRLTYMAADFGFLNPFPHRALFDALTMMKILDTYDLAHVIEVAKSPTLVIQALVSFADKDKAKTRGFYPLYENGKFQMWKMAIKECYLEREKAAAQVAGFDIRIISKK